MTRFVGLDGERHALADRSRRIVLADHAELGATCIVCEGLLVTEVVVLVGVDPDIVRGFVPQDAEEAARALRVAVAIEVLLNTGAIERVEDGLVELVDAIGAGCRSCVGLPAPGDLAVGSAHHVLHAQPLAVILLVDVDDGAIADDLPRRCAREGLRDLQLREQRVEALVDDRDRDAAAVERGVRLAPLGATHVGHRVVPIHEGRVREHRRPRGLRRVGRKGQRR